MIQGLADGILVGSIVSLGAIGLTLVMHMLRFANFSHAELMGIGAYAALVFDPLLGVIAPALAGALGPLSLTATLSISVVLAMAATGLSAVIIDRLVFKRIRETAGPLSMVFASFGVALIIRNLIALTFGVQSHRYSDEIAFAVLVSADPLLLVKPDQVFVFLTAIAIMIALHLMLSRTGFGYALRAVAENPALAQVAGVRLSNMIIAIWIIGGGLAALAGVFYALDNQLSPLMGHNLLLSLFAATIVGGIGSVYGAVLGGFIVGIASGVALAILPAGYAPAMPFIIIMAVLMVRPNGLFGEEAE